MTDPFLAEVRMFAGAFVPSGWALCNGQLLPIAQNSALFSLLGVTYGGDGRLTFALPNLSGSAPMHQGQGTGLSNRPLGGAGGARSVTLVSGQLPAHTHTATAAAGNGNSGSPVGTTWAQAAYGKGVTRGYSTAAPDQWMSPLTTQVTGGGLPHNNMPPYLCVTFIIALQGVFPQRP